MSAISFSFFQEFTFKKSLSRIKTTFNLDVRGNSMRGLRLYSTILVSVLFVFFGVIYWPSEKLKNVQANSSNDDEFEDLQLAESHFRKAKYDDVLVLMMRHEYSIGAKSDIGEEWLDLLVNTSEKTLDVPQLVLIDEHFPEALRKNEKASLLVAESYLMNGQENNYEVLREQWIGEEGNPGAWKILDSDHLLTQGKYEHCHKILENLSLGGKEEINRLVRLALLNSIENPEESLKLLSQASQLDPSDLDVYIYEVKLLEKLGRDKEALEIYKKAVIENPRSIFLRDQLANFYMQHHQFKEALNTLKDSLKVVSNEDDFIREEVLVKAIFLERMLQGKKTEWSQYALSNGHLKPLISYLLHLDKDKFVDEVAFSKLVLKEQYLEKNQVTYWLQLLEALKKNDHEKALTLIHESPFGQVSYNPDLELAYLQALNFEKTGSLLPLQLAKHHAENPLLKTILTSASLPDDIQALLLSNEAFSSLTLASGWTEAAIDLHQLDYVPYHFPSDVAFDFTEALRKNRGDQAALTYATRQNVNSNLSFLIQEMTARVALQEGNAEVAERIYDSISDKSYEAKSYLARKAFRENNFEKAQVLTEELLKKYPNNALLLDNLKKIQEKNA